MIIRDGRGAGAITLALADANNIVTDDTHLVVNNIAEDIVATPIDTRRDYFEDGAVLKQMELFIASNHIALDSYLKTNTFIWTIMEEYQESLAILKMI